jgi:hypothetical protein
VLDQITIRSLVSSGKRVWIAKSALVHCKLQDNWKITGRSLDWKITGLEDHWTGRSLEDHRKITAR